MRHRGITLIFIATAVTAIACGGDDSPTGTAAVTSVSVTAPNSNLFVGSTTQLSATAKDASGNAISGATVNWTSSSDAIATVSPTGLVTGVSPGNATITATSNGKTGTTTLTISSKIVNFAVSLTPAAEPPGLVGNPTGSGTFTATLDTTTNLFTWSGQFSGLTSTINNGHIHGPFVVGGAATTAGVLLNFNPAVSTGNSFTGVSFTGLNTATSGSVAGSVILNSSLSLTATVNGDSLRKLLLNGAAYVNIHTTSNPGGEIRAQLVKK